MSAWSRAQIASESRVAPHDKVDYFCRSMGAQPRQVGLPVRELTSWGLRESALCIPVAKSETNLGRNDRLVVLNP